MKWFYVLVLMVSWVCSAQEATALSANALIIKGTGQTVAKNTCSEPLTVELMNVTGSTQTPLTLPANTTVTLSGTNNVKFYRDPQCTSAISSTVIPAGQSQITVYFSDSSTGSTAITARIGGAIANGIQVESISTLGSGSGSGSGGSNSSTPPVRLGASVAAPSVPLGNCSAVTANTENNNFVPTPVINPTTITISGGNGNIGFFGDSQCTVKNASISLTAGQDSGTLYIKGSKEGSFILNVSASGYSTITEKEAITSPPPPACSGDQAPPTSAPSQSANAGYNTLVFDDEFNSSSTISPNNSGAYNWYTYNPYSTSAELSSSEYEVNDGCLTILSDNSGYSAGLMTIDSSTSTAGTFQHGYFEARMQFYPLGSNGSAWPAFWLYAIQAFQSATTAFAELDILEAYPTGGTNGVTPITTIHEWTVKSSGNTSVQNQNNVPTLPSGFNLDGFHIYGVLWTPDSVTWYIDNQPVTTVSTGPGTDFPSIEKDNMVMILGTGKNWPATYDYVHVWQ